jgi:hypothetical protein
VLRSTPCRAEFEQNVIATPLRTGGDLRLHIVVSVSFKMRTQQETAQRYTHSLSAFDWRVGGNLVGNFGVQRASKFVPFSNRDRFAVVVASVVLAAFRAAVLD